MPDDVVVTEEAIDIAAAEPGDARNVEPGERPPERLALSQDGQPAQARLKSFQADLFEQAAVVDDGPSPFFVVVLEIQRIGSGPPAPDNTVVMGNEIAGR